MTEPPASLESASDPELVRAAASGDRQAAGEYLARHLSYLSLMSRRLSMQKVDPEDLLSEAITRLLELWASGTGPTDEVNRYIIAAMRNRVIDELRSPRSRVAALEFVPDADLTVDDRAQTDRVDIHGELTTIRRAFEQLPEAQQKALHEIVVRGRKPAELVVELDRPAPAISSLLRRAKLGLRRSLLTVILSEKGFPDCVSNAQELPATILDSPDDYPMSDHQLDHVRSCPRCRAGWSRFAQLATALGLLPLLSMSLVLAGRPSGASAAPESRGGGTEPAASPRLPASESGALGPLGVATVAVAARFALAAAAVVIGVGILAAPAIPAGISPVTMMAAEASPRAPVEATLTAEVEGDTSSRSLAVSFAVRDAEWSIASVTLDLPEGITVRTAPTGWTCQSTPEGARCETAVRNSTGGVLTLSSPPQRAGQGYRLRIVAISGDTTINAEATGPLDIHTIRGVATAEMVSRP